MIVIVAIIKSVIGYVRWVGVVIIATNSRRQTEGVLEGVLEPRSTRYHNELA